MEIPPFELERYFARWEHATPYLLSASDVEPYRLDELLELATPDERRRFEGLGLGYTESAGDPRLRDAIASLYESATADDVLVFCGAEEAIFAFFHVAFAGGGHAVVVRPAYQSLYTVPEACGATVTAVTLEHDAGWRLDPERLAAAVGPETGALVVNFPHSPTGALPGETVWRRVVEISRQSGARLLSDEVYRHLEHDPAARLPAAVDLDERAVSLGVMSKSFGLAGLRIGWVACRDRELLARLAAFKDYTTICAPAPSEALATLALEQRERLWARSREILATNLPHLEAFFERFAGVVGWVPPRGGTVAFPRLEVEEPVEALTEALREEAGVLLLPGTVFHHPGRHFRIGFGRRDLPAALERLGRFLERRFPRAG